MKINQVLLDIYEAKLYICLHNKIKVIKTTAQSQQITMPLPNLIPGLVDKRVELFGTELEVYAVHNGVTHQWSNCPGWIKIKIQEHADQYPALSRYAMRQPGEFGGDALKKYAFYVFGKLNSTPDIDEDGAMNHEVSPYSARQLDVLRHGYLTDKEIADRIGTSRETVLSHWQNMRTNTGLQSKTQLVLQASRQGHI